MSKELRDLKVDSVSLIPLSKVIPTKIPEGKRYNLCGSPGCGNPASWGQMDIEGRYHNYRCQQHWGDYEKKAKEETAKRNEAVSSMQGR